MKKVTVLILWMLCLSGCSMPAWETVEDTLPAAPAAAWEEAIYAISIDTPESVAAMETTSQWEVYATQAGDFEVQTLRFLASSADEAVRTLSGYAPEELTVLQTSRFDLPEYRFAWVTQTEEGGRVCRADLVMDGVDCYAVVCSTKEDVTAQYEDEMRYVFSTFGLSSDEGV